MALLTTEALVLRGYKLGETSKVVVFLTRERGKVRAVARGARGGRPRYQSALEPLSEVRVTLYGRQGAELLRLGQAELLHSAFRVGERGLDAALFLSSCAELLDAFCPEGEAEDRVYRLALAVLRAVEGGADPDLVRRYLEAWLLRLQGLYPPLEHCASCSRGLPPGRREYHRPAHGFVCPACGPASGPILPGDACVAARPDLRGVPRDARGGCRHSRAPGPGPRGVSPAAGERASRARPALAPGGPRGEPRGRPLTLQEIIFTLQRFWSERGCLIHQPWDAEVGAGTMHPETFFRVLGPRPWKVGYVQPSRRPADGRYGENPNRLYKHQQFQVILKPPPADIQDAYLGSLVALGIDPAAHDVRFEEDNWESPDAGGVGDRVAGAPRRPGDHPVHLLPAGGGDRPGPDLGRDHLRPRADRDVPAGRRGRLPTALVRGHALRRRAEGGGVPAVPLLLRAGGHRAATSGSSGAPSTRAGVFSRTPAVAPSSRPTTGASRAPTPSTSSTRAGRSR